MSDFSQLLSNHIHEKNIKTYALAQYCGLDRSNMYKLINGKRKPSSLEMVQKICKFLNLSYAEQQENWKQHMRSQFLVLKIIIAEKMYSVSSTAFSCLS